MRRGKSHPVSDVLGAFLRESGLEVPLYEYRLLSTWHEVIPPTLARYITHSSIRNQILYLSVSSSVARHELFLHRKELVNQLNAHVGYQVITGIQLS